MIVEPCKGMILESAISEDVHGVLVEQHIDPDGFERFDILWSDSAFYDKVIVAHLMENRVLGYKTEEEILAWRLKYE